MSSTVIQHPKSRPVLLSLLTLFSGILIGAGATLLFVGHAKNDTPPLPEEFSRRMVAQLTRELGLTLEQQEQINPVVERHMQVLDEIRNEARPQIRQELERMNDEIMALLDEQQQQMWKDHIDRMQRRFRDFRDRRGPGFGERPDGDRRGREWRGERPEGDPNSPFRRRRPDDMRPGMMPPADPNAMPPRRSINRGMQI
jgi:hypothetical protein